MMAVGGSFLLPHSIYMASQLNLSATMALNAPSLDFKTTGDDKRDIEV